MKLTKSLENVKNVFSSEIFFKRKIHNFDYQSFCAQELADKELLKLATLTKKHVQSVEPRSSPNRLGVAAPYNVGGKGSLRQSLIKSITEVFVGQPMALPWSAKYKSCINFLPSYPLNQRGQFSSSYFFFQFIKIESFIT